MTSELLEDALAISGAWAEVLELHRLISTAIRDADVGEGRVDVVALGKAAREMASATRDVLGERVRRQLVIVDEGPAFSFDADVEYVIGEHPRPGLGSLMAGERLVAFLDEGDGADLTIFLVSGGASSLCALPQAPMDLEDLHELFAAVLESGADITTLNQLRAATSRIAGGAVLRHVRSARSLALLMVDNVVSGARWVASGLTYDFEPERADVVALLRRIGREEGPLAEVIRAACERRADVMREPVTTVHDNRVVAEPAQVLASVLEDAARRGFRTVDLGSRLHGDVQDVVDVMTEELSSAAVGERPVLRGRRGRGDAPGARFGNRWALPGVRVAHGPGARRVPAPRRGRGEGHGWARLRPGHCWWLVRRGTVGLARNCGIEWAARRRSDSDSYRALHEFGPTDRRRSHGLEPLRRLPRRRGRAMSYVRSTTFTGASPRCIRSICW